MESSAKIAFKDSTENPAFPVKYSYIFTSVTISRILIYPSFSSLHHHVIDDQMSEV